MGKVGRINRLKDRYVRKQDEKKLKPVKLRFIAIKLGVEPDELRERAVEKDGERVIALDEKETRILRNEYGGNLPKVGGFVLVEDALDI